MTSAATKYPIVLVHGVLVRERSFRCAFRGIKEELESKGATVFVARQDAVGRVETNAEQLKAEILDILAATDAQKVNLVAHSKGGVDSRYMISSLGMADKVASLTTVSTPHYGSKTVAKIMEMPRFLAAMIAFGINAHFYIRGDKHPDFYGVGMQMRECAMRGFNEDQPDMPGVYYRSYSSRPDKRASALVRITRSIENDYTDGFISRSSSMWGDYRGDTDTGADHWQLDGTRFGNKKRAVLDFYTALAADLAENGF